MVKTWPRVLLSTEHTIGANIEQATFVSVPIFYPERFANMKDQALWDLRRRAELALEKQANLPLQPNTEEIRKDALLVLLVIDAHLRLRGLL